ncbi:C-factor [Dactylellina cionopaga]|nr:C-factor [Dactylellina cionopaga]
MASYAITGASRGIGLAFVEVLSKDPSNTVFALVRNPTSSPPLTKLAESNKNVHIIKGDVTSAAELNEAASAVSKITGGKLDVLIENAALVFGNSGEVTLLDLVGDAEKTKTFGEDLNTSVNDNVMSVIHTTNAFLPLIKKGTLKKIAVLSTGIADVDATLAWGLAGNVPYCVSKAAVNMIVAKYATQVKEDGITIVSLSPGLVLTSNEEWFVQMYDGLTQLFRKTKPEFAGPITPETSVTMMLDVVGKLSVNDTGKFLSHNGNQDWL